MEEIKKAREQLEETLNQSSESVERFGKKYVEVAEAITRLEIEHNEFMKEINAKKKKKNERNNYKFTKGIY